MSNKDYILSLVSEVEQQMELHGLKAFGGSIFHEKRLAKYELQRWNDEEKGKNYHLFVDDCLYDNHRLKIGLRIQEINTGEELDYYLVSPQDLLEQNEDNDYFWTPIVPLEIERLMDDLLSNITGEAPHQKDDEIIRHLIDLIKEVEEQMEHQEEKQYLVIDPWRAAPRKERHARFPQWYESKPYVLSCLPNNDGRVEMTHLEECVFENHELKFVIETEDVASCKVIESIIMSAREVLEPDKVNREKWGHHRFIAMHQLLEDTLRHFNRLDIANSELTIERGWNLEELSLQFNAAFVAELQIFDGQQRITDGNLRIEEIGNVTCDSLHVRGIESVGEVVKRIHEAFGLTVRIVEQKHGREVDDMIPLYLVHEK